MTALVTSPALIDLTPAAQEQLRTPTSGRPEPLKGMCTCAGQAGRLRLRRHWLRNLFRTHPKLDPSKRMYRWWGDQHPATELSTVNHKEVECARYVGLLTQDGRPVAHAWHVGYNRGHSPLDPDWRVYIVQAL